jgi:predicted phosphodiesterase
MKIAVISDTHMPRGTRALPAVPQVERHEGVWILNPGSPTERRSAPARTMLELVVEGRDVAPQLVSFGA